MPQINQLPLRSPVSLGDQIPIYSPNNGDARRTPVSAVVDLVVNGLDLSNMAVLLTGNQTVGGIKTFSNAIVGSITGNAGSVTNGVYTVGNQTIGGTKTFSGVNTFGNASGQLFLASTTTTQDGVVINGRAGGSSSFRVTISPTTLTASHALTLPDNSGTILTTGAAVTIEQGGTGHTTANAALNALLPSQGSNANKYLTTDGSNTSWAAAGSLTLNVVTGTTQTAVADNHYVLTNVAATTLTLPASPAAGELIWVTVGNGLTTNVVARNGNNIQSLSEDLTLDAAYAAIQLRYINSTIGWTFI
jgi:hypothetical protein